MGTVTNVKSSTAATSERFQSWFNDSPIAEDLNRSPSSNQQATGVGQTLTFENVRIDFPLRPYPAQVQMMRKIIHTLNESENALLESPTGSGKSLALLCAALAWRENEERRVTEQLAQSKEKVLVDKKVENKSVIKIEDSQSIVVEKNIVQSTSEGLSAIDDDFQDDKVNKRPNSNLNDPIHWRKRFKCEDESVISVEDDSFEDFQAVKIKKILVNDDENIPPSQINAKVKAEDISNLKYQAFNKLPRIFVGSRTHKQITQLVKELKSKTNYRPRTTILGSREHLCIHPKVSKSSNKAEDCVDLLDKSNCHYAKRAHNVLTHRSLKNENRIWDIEDIVKLGKRVKGCPYYASRKLYEGAEVIFCPYNYIIDPIIRKVLDINLKNSIVILDEAHNIEDSSRSAGSFEVDESVLLIISKELEQIIRLGIEVEAHGTLQLVIDNLREWITSPDVVYTTKEFESHYCHWTGAELISKLDDINISSTVFENRLKQAYSAAAAHAEMIRKETENQGLGEVVEQDELSSQVQIHRRKCLSNSSLTVIQGIFMVLGLLFEQGRNYADDYQMVLSKRVDRSGNLDRADRNKRRRKNDGGPEWSFKLGFKCLNPGVIFRDVTETTRSVILTSGTLSPLNTFASELETKFEGRLEANHVIHHSQVWAGAIPRGPNQTQLKGIFSNMESFQYQDDIGESLCQIVETIPFGVLCFMPSYNAMDKLIKRWKTTGVHDRLLEKKMIICEPRGSDKQEFESAIGQFYQQIDDVEIDLDEEGRDGALFFAVFRGKVSEGIDFTDNYCRAVVTIGIPYPGVKDMDVKFKKEYNDWKKAHRSNSGVLSSAEWYSTQAFRAINQALGRCIRHKNDWGAIIMLEERFAHGNLSQGLSKWVRNQFRVYPEFPSAKSSLEEFVKTQVARTSKPIPQAKPLTNEPSNTDTVEAALTAPEVSQPIEAMTVDTLINKNPLANTVADNARSSSRELNLNEQLHYPATAGTPLSIPETSSVNSNFDNIPHKLPNYPNEEAEIRSAPRATVETVSSFFQPKIPTPDQPAPETSMVNNSIPITTNPSIVDFTPPFINSKEPLPLQNPNHPFVMPISQAAPVLKSNPTADMQIQNHTPQTIISRNDLMSPHQLDNVKSHISCTLCQKPLLHGLLGNLKPVSMKNLKLISDNVDIRRKEMVEVRNPYSWKTTEHLMGGPLDFRLLPSQIEVILSVADGICYRFIGCSCSSNKAIGLVICEANNPQAQQYKGRVLIWFSDLKVERETEELPQEDVFGEKMTIPSSQAPTMNDLFYNL